MLISHSAIPETNITAGHKDQKGCRQGKMKVSIKQDEVI